MTMLNKVPDIHTITETEIQAALKLILASKQFIKAHRSRRLLRFLVEQTLLGSTQDISEYSIGIDVFDRDPAIYTTIDDPIVRVQVGRLREKLKNYYSTPPKTGSDIEISIPAGSYIPLVQRVNTAKIETKPYNILAIHPFKCISHHGDGIPFTQGLDEELIHQLFKAFGQIIVPHTPFTPTDTHNKSRILKNISGAGVNHLLEGSVQIDSQRIKASIRLVDISVGRITWSEQFDRDAFFAITLQEELALSICSALKQFFVTSKSAPSQ